MEYGTSHHWTPVSLRTRNHLKDLLVAVDNLLDKGAIEPGYCQCFMGYFSLLFLIFKETRDLCPVIDLTILNNYLVVSDFKMETQSSVRASIREEEWTVSIDIQGAYLCVLIHRDVPKCLHFIANSKVYKFTCLPFGLDPPLRESTKSLCPVLQGPLLLTWFNFNPSMDK